MLVIGNKKYRTPQEQVGFTTEQIEKIAEYLDGLNIQDKLVIVDDVSGTFTEEEMDILRGPLAFVSNGYKVYIK